MRKETINITELDIMSCIAGELVRLAPVRIVRNLEIIIQKVRDKIRADSYNHNEYYILTIEPAKLYDYINDLMKSIPEFVELNLTQIEYENKVSVDDESRAKFKITTMYDVNTSYSWKYDFIDLEAFVQNVHYKLTKLKDFNDDCFSCIHEDSEKCNTCLINPKFTNNHEFTREPKGEYTFACKHDCFVTYYICCEECKNKETCVNKCDSNSQTCRMKINEINKGDNKNK